VLRADSHYRDSREKRNHGNIRGIDGPVQKSISLGQNIIVRKRSRRNQKHETRHGDLTSSRPPWELHCAGIQPRKRLTSDPRRQNRFPPKHKTIRRSQSLRVRGGKKGWETLGKGPRGGEIEGRSLDNILGLLWSQC